MYNLLQVIGVKTIVVYILGIQILPLYLILRLINICVILKLEDTYFEFYIKEKNQVGINFLTHCFDCEELTK